MDEFTSLLAIAALWGDWQVLVLVLLWWWAPSRLDHDACCRQHVALHFALAAALDGRQEDDPNQKPDGRKR